MSFFKHLGKAKLSYQYTITILSLHHLDVLMQPHGGRSSVDVSDGGERRNSLLALVTSPTNNTPFPHQSLPRYSTGQTFSVMLKRSNRKYTSKVGILESDGTVQLDEQIHLPAVTLYVSKGNANSSTPNPLTSPTTPTPSPFSPSRSIFSPSSASAPPIDLLSPTSAARLQFTLADVDKKAYDIIVVADGVSSTRLSSSIDLAAHIDPSGQHYETTLLLPLVTLDRRTTPPTHPLPAIKIRITSWREGAVLPSDTAVRGNTAPVLHPAPIGPKGKRASFHAPHPSTSVLPTLSTFQPSFSAAPHNDGAPGSPTPPYHASHISNSSHDLQLDTSAEHSRHGSEHETASPVRVDTGHSHDHALIETQPYVSPTKDTGRSKPIHAGHKHKREDSFLTSYTQDFTRPSGVSPPQLTRPASHSLHDTFARHRPTLSAEVALTIQHNSTGSLDGMNLTQVQEEDQTEEE